jgi:hypothetical protein
MDAIETFQDPVILDPGGEFPRNYNRVNFMFPHELAGSPLWQLPSLIEVQNSNNVSVALSVTYELRSVDRIQELRRFNRQLRALGLTPTPPGRSPWRDEIKLATCRAARSSRKPKPQLPSYPTWTPPAA